MTVLSSFCIRKFRDVHSWYLFFYGDTIWVSAKHCTREPVIKIFRHSRKISRSVGSPNNNQSSPTCPVNAGWNYFNDGHSCSVTWARDAAKFIIISIYSSYTFSPDAVVLQSAVSTTNRLHRIFTTYEKLHVYT